MAEGQDSGQERTLEPTPRKLEQARRRGDVPTSREGSAAGVMLAALLGVLLVGGMTAQTVGGLILPMLERPETFLDFTEAGWRAASGEVAKALAVAIAPLLGMAVAGALVPHLLQNSVVVAGERIKPKFSNLSPGRGFKRILGGRALFEFAKALVKMLAVGAACYAVGRGLYDDSLSLVAVDLAAAPVLARDALVGILLAATLVGAIVAGVDVPYQHWSWRRKQRMSFQEMKEEMRSTEGDPHIKARLRALRRQRARRRMMQDVPKASVVITNPTHYAVALRYRRGQDAAPVVVAKGQDLVALKIREVAQKHGVAVVQDPPLARALHAAVDIGEVIPQAHFEAVAKIVGLVWARRGAAAGGGARAR
jgi:flagellar biosynthetic protein FlhB